MAFYAVLFFCTVLIFLFTQMIWVKTREFSIILGVALIYYYSLFGGWSIIADLIESDSSKDGVGFRYLYREMFYVNLDTSYLYSICLYTIFILCVLIVLFFKVDFYVKKQENKNKSSPIYISHKFIIVASGITTLISIVIFGNELTNAFVNQVSAYTRDRSSDSATLFGVGSVFTRMSLFSLSIGIATYCSGKRGKFLIGKEKRSILISYVVLSLICYSFSALLGNKGELFQSVICGFSFYLTNISKPNVKALVFMSLAFLVTISMIDVFRGVPPSEILSSVNQESVSNSLTRPNESAEKIAAHLSMYGVLINDIPMTYGSSIIFLLFGFLPKFIIPQRPPDIYEYYAESLKLPQGQGFTIHHATGWYLNLGFIGLLIGALLYGYIWSNLINTSYRDKSSKLFVRILAIISPHIFLACTSSSMRGGPEVYRPILIDIFLSGLPIILFSTKFSD